MADEENTGRISPNAEATDAGLGREGLPWPKAYIGTLYVDNVETDFFGGSALLDVGTTAGTVAAGDDARLSDTRDPKAHTHAQSDITNLATDLAGKMSVPASVTELPETPSTGVIYARFADDEDDGHYYYTGTEWRQL